MSWFKSWKHHISFYETSARKSLLYDTELDEIDDDYYERRRKIIYQMRLIGVPYKKIGERFDIHGCRARQVYFQEIRKRSKLKTEPDITPENRRHARKLHQSLEAFTFSCQAA